MLSVLGSRVGTCEGACRSMRSRVGGKSVVLRVHVGACEVHRACSMWRVGEWGVASGMGVCVGARNCVFRECTSVALRVEPWGACRAVGRVLGCV